MKTITRPSSSDATEQLDQAENGPDNARAQYIRGPSPAASPPTEDQVATPEQARAAIAHCRAILAQAHPRHPSSAADHQVMPDRHQ